MSIGRVLIAIAAASGIAALCPLNGLSGVNVNSGYRLMSDTSGATLWGTRATIDNPSGSEMNVANGDSFNTTVFAEDYYSSSLIDQGVEYEWNNPEQPLCNLGSQGSGPFLYYYVEVAQSGNYSCYNEGYANNSESHKHTVMYNASNGLWYEYMDGVYQGITTSWTTCQKHACHIYAFGEDSNAKSGLYNAKFAGSGNTPWQFYDGSVWTTITGGYSTHLDPYWNVYGPFPTGIWKFTYSH